MIWSNLIIDRKMSVHSFGHSVSGSWRISGGPKQFIAGRTAGVVRFVSSVGAALVRGWCWVDTWKVLVLCYIYIYCNVLITVFVSLYSRMHLHPGWIASGKRCESMSILGMSFDVESDEPWICEWRLMHLKTIGTFLYVINQFAPSSWPWSYYGVHQIHMYTYYACNPSNSWRCAYGSGASGFDLRLCQWLL